MLSISDMKPGDMLVDKDGDTHEVIATRRGHVVTEWAPHADPKRLRLTVFSQYNVVELRFRKPEQFVYVDVYESGSGSLYGLLGNRSMAASGNQVGRIKVVLEARFDD